MRILVLAIISLAVAACSTGPAPPTAAEISAIQAAPKPSSDEAARAAVKKYLAGGLFDAPAALYHFPLPPVRGSRMFGDERQFGWFMCGEINGKNRMGGYTGYRPFLVYFSPSAPDVVADSLIGDSDHYAEEVETQCQRLYGRPIPVSN